MNETLTKQEQSLLKNIMKVKDEVGKMEFTAECSFVSVKVNGKKEVLKVTIKPDSNFSLDYIDMLENMVKEAINVAMTKVDETMDKKMEKYFDMMPIKFLF